MEYIWTAISLLSLARFGASIYPNANPQDDNFSGKAEWIYVTGGSNASTVKGTQLSPGPRSRAAGWGDEEGNFWMFGGLGFDSVNPDTAHITNDLWLFNLSTLTWYIIEDADKDAAIHGKPMPRRGAAACGVNGIIIALFGGEGFGGKMLDDTWIFDIGKKSWLRLEAASKVDGSKGQPQGRVSPVLWCCHDSIIIYGGKTNDGLLNDMWQFSLTDLTWTKVELLQESEVNPGGRLGATTWITGNNLWLFGGATEVKGKKGLQLLSDLWQFSMDTRQWCRVLAGHVDVGDDGEISQSSNEVQDVNPEPRKFSQAWQNKEGSLLFMFGGEGHTKMSAFNKESQLFDSLWQFDVKVQKWEKTPFHTAQIHNVTGLHLPCRSRGNCWVGRQGEFYLFGGLAYDISGKVSQMNDIWSLVPPHTPIPSHFVGVSIRTVSYSESLVKTKHKPAFVFVMVLLTFGGVVMVVGAVFCMKKMSDYPRHHPSNRFKVKYSKLDKNDDPEDEAEQFLLEDSDEVRASFTIVE